LNKVSVAENDVKPVIRPPIPTENRDLIESKTLTGH